MLCSVLLSNGEVWSGFVAVVFCSAACSAGKVWQCKVTVEQG